MRKAISSGTHVDMRTFAVSHGNMNRFVNDVVPGADIFFPHLTPMFIDWSEAVGRLTSSKNYDDLNVRRAFNPKFRTKLNPSLSSTNVLASVSSATFGSHDYRYS